jgi:hypothetical protein
MKHLMGPSFVNNNSKNVNLDEYDSSSQVHISSSDAGEEGFGTQQKIVMIGHRKKTEDQHESK